MTTTTEDFSPTLLALQRDPPARTPRLVGLVTVGLFAAVAAWAVWGQLDIIVSSEGRLVPRNYSRVLQPAEAGVVRKVLVREGDEVAVGQVLFKMDATTAVADTAALRADVALKSLALRRIDAELNDKVFTILPLDPPDYATHTLAQYHAHRQLYLDSLQQEQSNLRRAQHELAAAKSQFDKLSATVPLYQQAAESHAQLVREGFVSALGANDKTREKIEKEQELKSQHSTVAALAAAVDQSMVRVTQIKSSYRSQLRNERAEVQSQLQRHESELKKQVYRSGLLELKAADSGIVKDLAITTAGAVVQPGAVLLNIVPKTEQLVAEVAIKNEDVGFVAIGQKVQIKFQAFPFQKYGMLEGVVELVSADSSSNDPQHAVASGHSPQSYKALLRLQGQELVSASGERLKLAPGMVVLAEIQQGKRSVLEYLLSPVQKVVHEAGRER